MVAIESVIIGIGTCLLSGIGSWIVHRFENSRLGTRIEELFNPPEREMAQATTQNTPEEQTPAPPTPSEYHYRKPMQTNPPYAK
jgi:hypothetical protein